MVKDPVKNLKDYIIALNTVAYNDDAGLDHFLAQVKGTFQQTFGSFSQYLTYLNSIHFHPISSLATPEDCVRAWGNGKKQLRDLLFVVLEDPVLNQFESWDERELEREAVGAVAEAERIVASHRKVGNDEEFAITSSLTEVIHAFKNKVRVDISVSNRVNEATIHHGISARDGVSDIHEVPPAGHGGPQELPRIRIDLRDLNLLDDGVEQYLVHRSAFLVKDHSKKIFFIPGDASRVNQQISKFLNATEAVLIEADTTPASDRSIQEQIAENVAAQMAIVVLSEDCWVRFKGDGRETAMAGPSPAACFLLGYLVSRYGRNRVVALYEESPKFRRPTGYFDVFYIPLSSSGSWRRELTARLKENKIAVKDLSNPFFYKG